LHTFIHVIKQNGLAVSAKKIVLCQTKIRFLGHNIQLGTLTPIQRSLDFTCKFPDEILDKNSLQRFLGCVNYVGDFVKEIRILCAPLFKRLKKHPDPWSHECTIAVQKVKKAIKSIPCLSILDPSASIIVETDASDIGYGGVLKQVSSQSSQEQLVRFHSGVWSGPQKNYSTIKKEILAIVLVISKFQDDLINKNFILKTDCKASKDVLQKDVKNLVSKQIFARWQAILSCFDFQIIYIQGSSNFLADFLTREFLQKERESERK
jgi:hypothetical protein